MSQRLESSIRRADTYDLQVLPDEIGEDGARIILTFEAAGQPDWTQTIYLSNELGPWEITSGTPREGVATIPGAAETEQPTG